ncbi:MAG: DMT family transporter [Holophagales bacterium]|nr:DMT family transporter [Holophagales bacterium]MBK9968219.1 DMT family transporter [Holophagales bacterium]
MAAERRARESGLAPFVALLFVQLFFGTLPVLGKVAMRELSPFTLAAVRGVFGALLLSLAARALSGPAPRQSPGDRLEIAFLALFGIVANQVLFISGLHRTTATHATLLVATVPVFTIVIELLMRREKPSARRLLGVPIAFGGVVFLLDPAGLSFGSATLAGDLLVTANSAAYAFFLVRARDVLARRSALSFVAQAFRYGAVPIVFIALPDLVRLHPADLSARTVAAAAGVVLLGTVGAYALNAWALARTGASTTAFFIYIQPLFAGALAFLALGERPSSRLFGAAVLIFTGVAFAIWPSRAGRPAA